jgi:endoglucanase
MCFFRLFLIIILLLNFNRNLQAADGFLKVSGHNFVDAQGNTVFLRGVGLGNWLLPEGYMWKFGPDGDRPRKIEHLITEMVGPQKAQEFWTAWQKNYISESDIRRIAQLGFNTVRPALNARLFLTEEDNPKFIESSFVLLDSLIARSERHGLYVILDMHGAPGGQTGANIDDSPDSRPELFMDKKYQDRLVDLWVKLAGRYHDNTTVVAYDLLNEPLPANTGAAEKYKHLVLPLYQRITAAIREVDKNHMITLEGVDWANDWSIFTGSIDDNVFYQFHYYCWDWPDYLKSVQQYIDLREKLNAPVWVGETGEQGKTIFWGTTQYFEANNIGWSFWPWKKMDTRNTPYSINKPDGWDAIAAYSRGEEKPDSTLAARALDQLVNNIKMENCQYFPDVVNAILRRVPGKIEAENYSHGGNGVGFSVQNPQQKSPYYRIDEPVQIRLLTEEKSRRSTEQAIILQSGEWTAYQFDAAVGKPWNLVIRVEAQTENVELQINVNGQTASQQLTGTGWQNVAFGTFTLNEKSNRLTVGVEGGSAAIDWMEFSE